MGMFSEIAINGTVRPIVIEIKRLLEKSESEHEAEALKAVGRLALTLFDWDSPEWAAEYRELFKAAR